MERRQRIDRIRQWLREDGLLSTLRLICTRSYQRIFPPVPPTHPFDLKHAVDTSGLILGRKLRSNHANDIYNTAYWGTAPSLLYGAIERWRETLPQDELDERSYTFADVGCGKGRVVMLASDLPFRRVIGIDLNAALVSTAQQNLTQWMTKHHACDRVDVLAVDAMEYPLPEGPMLLYLFNPFDAPLMERFVDRLCSLRRERSAPIDVIYVFPFHAQFFAQHAEVRLLWQGDVALSEEDTAADIFRKDREGCRIYRLD
jgi:SAM-dependent methyltransferase